MFPKERIAVFVDGCFWHGCPEHGVIPKSNREWWTEKLRRNGELREIPVDTVAAGVKQMIEAEIPTIHATLKPEPLE